jgi:hypothetical protein
MEPPEVIGQTWVMREQPVLVLRYAPPRYQPNAVARDTLLDESSPSFTLDFPFLAAWSHPDLALRAMHLFSFPTLTPGMTRKRAPI